MMRVWHWESSSGEDENGQVCHVAHFAASPAAEASQPQPLANASYLEPWGAVPPAYYRRPVFGICTVTGFESQARSAAPTRTSRRSTVKCRFRSRIQEFQMNRRVSGVLAGLT